ncbi:hypothetical protein OEIGOIKO_00758 [Streptomyces chrestomyceticus JCM 4735]|uniref:Uncharacterized protein n=1 Tax=Streptomyces chrestomyceticus JCM 4735 TaxID=1306181 RepID=A0A7U9PW66_9ACTN|nr:hypothetical protein OEIGOIKO_00758 [Streptomyces chrestomyceticus JCM 4735]
MSGTAASRRRHSADQVGPATRCHCARRARPVRAGRPGARSGAPSAVRPVPAGRRPGPERPRSGEGGRRPARGRRRFVSARSRPRRGSPCSRRGRPTPRGGSPRSRRGTSSPRRGSPRSRRARGRHVRVTSRSCSSSPLRREPATGSRSGDRGQPSFHAYATRGPRVPHRYLTRPRRDSRGPPDSGGSLFRHGCPNGPHACRPPAAEPTSARPAPAGPAGHLPAVHPTRPARMSKYDVPRIMVIPGRNRPPGADFQEPP